MSFTPEEIVNKLNDKKDIKLLEERIKELDKNYKYHYKKIREGLKKKYAFHNAKIKLLKDKLKILKKHIKQNIYSTTENNINI